MAAHTGQTYISALAKRAMNDPQMLSEDEIRMLGQYAQRCHRQATAGKSRQIAIAGAETFRHKIETIQIFRGLEQRLREHPTGAATIKAVQIRLKELGITCSERTLMRDFREMGGATQLRKTKPFEPNDDRSPIIAKEAVAVAKTQ
jgi:hypothetical protein